MALHVTHVTTVFLAVVFTLLIVAGLVTAAEEPVKLGVLGSKVFKNRKPILTPEQAAAEQRRKERIWKARGIVREVPYETFNASQVHKTDGCVFKGCPADHPFLYFLTSHRNRAASLNRLLRTLAKDIGSPVNTHPSSCICFAAADFNDVVVGPPISAAFEDWPYDKGTISVPGHFSRAGGFQRCIDHLVVTPKNESIVFLVDADLTVYPGLVNRIFNYTRLDKWAFAPAVWSTAKNDTDPYDGYWRSGGTGMISFFVSELDKFGGRLPLVSKVSWGGEDHKLTKYLEKKAMLRIKRTCTPELWHLYHHKSFWTSAADGQHHRSKEEMAAAKKSGFDPADNSWKLPLPLPEGQDVIISRGKLNRYRCRMLAKGTMYPPDAPPGVKVRPNGPM